MLSHAQRFELKYDFPKYPQIFGEWIVRRLRRKETIADGAHPCMKHYDSFLVCVRRHPNTYEAKCRGEAGRCLACLERHQDWKMPNAFNYMRFLEYLRVFSEGRQSLDEGPGKFRYERATTQAHGKGTVMKFAGMERGTESTDAAKRSRLRRTDGSTSRGRS